MRLFVALAISVAATAPGDALACPPGARCVIDAPAASEVAAPRRALSLRVEAPPEPAPWRLDVAPVREPASDMPWIWQVLRREVADAMPTYRDRDLTLSLSPVVISGSFDTVPGVGVAGDF